MANLLWLQKFVSISCYGYELTFFNASGSLTYIFLFTRKRIDASIGLNMWTRFSVKIVTNRFRSDSFNIKVI